MREFWVASGHHLTRRADHGGLVATPELIMAYLARPELMPPADACDASGAFAMTRSALLLRGVRKLVRRLDEDERGSIGRRVTSPGHPAADCLSTRYGTIPERCRRGRKCPAPSDPVHNASLAK